MVQPAVVGIPNRPDRPLVVKCGHEGNLRRITFPSSATCRLKSLRSRVEECFSLSASPFSLIYLDDDGEEFPIRAETDLTEAILYFDDAAISSYSGLESGGSPTHQRVIIRLDVVVEYDGPSLSDTSSIHSLGSGTEEEFSQDSLSFTSNEYEPSYRSYGTNGFTEDSPEEGKTEYAGHAVPSGRTRKYSRTTSDGPTVSNGGHSVRIAGQTLPQLPPLTGPDSDPAPSLLTHSELGSRWLKEQSRLATKRYGSGPASGRSTRPIELDDGSGGSDDDAEGDLALIRDARGKYYYAYQSTETSTVSSQSGTSSHPTGGGSARSTKRHSPSLTIHTASPPGTPQAKSCHSSVRPDQTLASPIFAPHCSVCEERLDYMRYVCQICGEGEMWRVDERRASLSRVFSETGLSDRSSETEWANQAGPLRSPSRSRGSHREARPRGSSTSTSRSRGSFVQGPDYASSPTGAIYRSGPTPPESPIHGPVDSSTIGYELCPACVETHGSSHAKEAARHHAKGRTKETRHAFREKIWGDEGWADVEFPEDVACSICRSPLLRDSYKCISCPRFDLCTSCYRKVEEIHPTHTFLSLPDPPSAYAGPSRHESIFQTNGHEQGTEAASARHPGAFCHNCLQDIRGPRFHCAVCPSWDLCSRCEGISAPDDASGHNVDHIMMKIPLPLPSAEVEAVSRRARDRWLLQDSNNVAAANGGSFRSSSPASRTVYGGFLNQATVSTRPAQRDALDHQCRCNSCNEWITGRRFQCANCPSEPEAYSLCSVCELRSYRLHDPQHVFFKLDRPVHIPLSDPRPLLPLLYKSRVGDIPAGAVVNSRDPIAYLQHVLHRDTVCDIHADQIRGAWLRCAHCAEGFDICQEAEQIANHDPSHVFVVFKAKVDMTAFRELAELGEAQSKPLLGQKVYLE